MPPPSRSLADGPRPAAEWVTSLPLNWTTPRQRLILLVLSLDTFDPEPPFTSEIRTDELARRCGAYKGTLLRDRDALVVPLDGVRPALLDVEIGRGRTPSRYRLCTEVGPELWSHIRDHKLQSRRRDHNGNASQSRSGDHNDPRSGLGSGLGRSLSPETTPFPSPSVDQVQHQPQDARARCWHQRRTADGDCLDCGRNVFSQEAS